MSEYQYYEFQAIDRPLTQSQMRELRSCSTRATITSTRFVNEYHWGDFKGNPRVWIERYFDAFLYSSNWGEREFMLRLPCRLLDLESARRYCRGASAAVRRKGEHVIIEFHSEDGDIDDGLEDAAQLSALVPLRADLARGDYRSLYLAWLSCVRADEIRNDAEEPPAPAALGPLSGSLRAFAEFMRIDGDLIAAAAERSSEEGDLAPRQDVKQWVLSLSEAEKNRVLIDTALGKHDPQTEVLRKFRGNPNSGRSRSGTARTVAQLLAAAKRREEKRRRDDAEHADRERARRGQVARAVRKRYLDDLARQEAEAWAKVDHLIVTRQPKNYDDAVALLRDLRELATSETRGSQVRGAPAAHPSAPRGKTHLHQATPPIRTRR